MSHKGRVCEFINALKWATAVTKAPKSNLSTCAICACWPHATCCAAAAPPGCPGEPGHLALFHGISPNLLSKVSLSSLSFFLQCGAQTESLTQILEKVKSYLKTNLSFVYRQPHHHPRTPPSIVTTRYTMHVGRAGVIVVLH